MKLLVLFIGLAAAVSGYEQIFTDYHEQFGIAEAARIKRAEEAQDFDGSRIAGGSAAAVGAQPHLGGLIVTLTDNRQSVCGSTLLTNTRLLTAAHCWRHGNNQGRQFTVVLASNRLFTGGTRINTSNVQVHGSYNQNNLNNDIAIIVINHVNFNANIARALVASGSNNYAGTWAVVAGFGLTGDNASIGSAQAKRQLNVQVITNAVCAQTFGTSTIVASTLCVATPGGQSPCPGDSGGPLAIGSGNSRTVIGVVSFGSIQGCTRGFPAAFARVTSFAAWINARL